MHIFCCSKASVIGLVTDIKDPEIPLALRIIGSLLVGVVRIHDAQTLFLLEDAKTTWSALHQT